MMALRTLRLQLRFLLPLGITLVVAAYLAVPLLDQVTLRWFSRDLNSRGALVANALSDSITDALTSRRIARLGPLFDRAAQDERLFALGLCGLDGLLIQSTERFPASLSCGRAIDIAQDSEPGLALSGGAVHVGVQDIMGSRPAAATPQGIVDEPAAVRRAMADAQADAPVPDTVDPGPRVVLARLILLHDLSFIERRSQDTRRYLIGLIAVLGLVIALVTVVVAQLSWRGWVNGVRALLRGEGLVSPIQSSAPELAPFAADLRARLRDLQDEYWVAEIVDLPLAGNAVNSAVRHAIHADA